MRDLLKSEWYTLLNNEQQALVTISVELFEKETGINSAWRDYSFIVFPISKAYEGFLKQRFFDLGLIDEKTFKGKRFRIGKALNPDIHERSKDEHWLFDDLEQMCGTQVAQELWETWLHCRNRVFHFYPQGNNLITLNKAEELLIQVSSAMKTVIECQITFNEDQKELSEKNKAKKQVIFTN